VKLLLLAGTGEAVALAAALAEAGVPTVARLAGATRAPKTLAVPMEIGGWGGAAPFRTWLSAEGIDGVIDATHPFAARISARTAEVCRAENMPYLQVLRPPWMPQTGDTWVEVATEEDVGMHIPKGATVFLATGRQTLERFVGLTERRLICRQIDPPEHPFPFPNGAYLVGRPPFSVEDERALFQRLGVDWLVVKNAGGAASATKLTAARELGLPVAMIARPPQPDAERVETVEAAMDWVRARWTNG